MATWTRACGIDEAADGEVCAVKCGGKSLIILREGERVYASDGICTHADADLSTGFVAPGAGQHGSPGVRCPLHLSVFDMETGIPLNPPAESPLGVYPARIDGNAVYVEV